MAGRAHGGDDAAAAQVKGLSILQIVADGVGICGPGANVLFDIIGVFLAGALGDKAGILAAEVHALHRILADVFLVHVIIVKPTQTADVVAVRMGDDQHDGLIGNVRDHAAQIADAAAGIDDHRLVRAHQHEDRAAVEFVDFIGVLCNFHNRKRFGCHIVHSFFGFFV